MAKSLSRKDISEIVTSDLRTERCENVSHLEIRDETVKSVRLVSHVLLFVTPWTIAHQAPLSMGILHARTVERVAKPSSRGSSQPRDRTQVSHIAGRFFTAEPPKQGLNNDVTWYIIIIL